MNITTAGTGYVGLSKAVLLAQHNKVIALDIVPAKGSEVVAYESALEAASFFSSRVISSLEEFQLVSDVIIANRRSDALKDVVGRI